LAALILTSCGDGNSDPGLLPSHSEVRDAVNGSEKRLTPVIAAVDILTLSGSYRNYTISKNGSQFIATDRSGSPTPIPANIQRLRFSDGAIGLDITGTSGQAYRLYQAAFNRKPDLPGVGYWIDRIDSDMSFYDVAWNFINSDEFRRLYGTNVSNDEFIVALYANVLHRAPDRDGFLYWSDLLGRNVITRHAMLAEFGNSPENIAQVAYDIQYGVLYLPLGVQGPPTDPNRPPTLEPVPRLPPGVDAQCRVMPSAGNPGLARITLCNDTPAYAPQLRPGLYSGFTLATATESSTECTGEVTEEGIIRLTHGGKTVRVVPNSPPDLTGWASIVVQKARRINEMYAFLTVGDGRASTSASFKWSGALHNLNTPYSIQIEEGATDTRMTCINMRKLGVPAPAPVVDASIPEEPLTNERPSPIPDFTPPAETCAENNISGPEIPTVITCYNFQKYIPAITAGLWRGVPHTTDGSSNPLAGSCTMRLQENGAVSVVSGNQRYGATPFETALINHRQEGRHVYSLRSNAPEALSVGIVAFVGQRTIDNLQIYSSDSGNHLLNCRGLAKVDFGQMPLLTIQEK
jgi:hypothetical protein